MAAPLIEVPDLWKVYELGDVSVTPPARDSPAGDPGRRADRQSRQPHVGRDPRRLPALEPRAGNHGRARHARAGHLDLRWASHHVSRRAGDLRRPPDRRARRHRSARGGRGMKLLRMTLQAALRALRRNKMRSVLTMLGIIIGVAAVIAMVSVGQGANSAVQKQIESLGTN